MYSSSRSATTHIFFPPRFEIVAEQEDSDGFPSYTGNQFAFDGFFRYQTDGPTSATFRRIAAYHCNQTLLLAVVEHFRRSRPLFFVQCALQAALRYRRPMLRMASAVSGTTSAICGALAPFASCSKAKARRTTRTCWTPPLNRLASSL